MIAKLFANSGDPDQMPQNAASDMGLHCLQISFLRISRIKWTKFELWMMKLSNFLFVINIYLLQKLRLSNYMTQLNA